MRQKITLLLYIIIIIPLSLSSYAATDSYQKDLNRLYDMSRINMNLGGIIKYDSILKLCDSLEIIAKTKSDLNNLFKIQMISVTSLCMKDDLGLAVTKSRNMYNEAMSNNHDIGIALSTQAIANTLLYSGQLKNALSTMDEAISKFIASKDSINTVIVLLQQMQLCHYVNNYNKLLESVNLLKSIIDNHDRPDQAVDRRDFRVMALCYEAIYYILTNNTVKGWNIISSLDSYGANQHLTCRWKQYVTVKYYIQIREHTKALLLTDSIIVKNKNCININELKRTLITKAQLYEKIGDYDKACDTYEAVHEISNKIEKEGYTRQIETLHMSYVVDKIKLENAIAQNNLLNKILLYTVLVLIMASIFLFIIYRRNKASLKSKLELAEIKDTAYNSIQSKSLFLSNMSHDLRTPLNAIVGFSDILSENDDLDEETKEMCNEHIKQNAELLTKLFNDILDISSLQENNIKFTFNQHNIVGICDNVIKTVEKVNKSKAVLSFENNVDSLTLETDLVRLKQVLINLLVNATKFTEKGSIKLRLSFDNQTQEAIFVIEDTGCGIPKERQAHIFERFEKLHESKQGVGLGLSICNLIVTKFGGKIWIDPDYTDGTRFIFTHPVEKQRE